MGDGYRPSIAHPGSFHDHSVDIDFDLSQLPLLESMIRKEEDYSRKMVPIEMDAKLHSHVASV